MSLLDPRLGSSNIDRVKTGQASAAIKYGCWVVGEVAMGMPDVRVVVVEEVMGVEVEVGVVDVDAVGAGEDGGLAARRVWILELIRCLPSEGSSYPQKLFGPSVVRRPISAAQCALRKWGLLLRSTCDEVEQTGATPELLQFGASVAAGSTGGSDATISIGRRPTRFRPT